MAKSSPKLSNPQGVVNDGIHGRRERQRKAAAAEAAKVTAQANARAAARVMNAMAATSA